MSNEPVPSVHARLGVRRPLLAFVSASGQIRYVELGEEALSIGRSPRSDIPLRNATVSLRHARIEPSGDGRFLVVDCDSKNGTFVNDQPIERHVLRPGDKIRLGDTVFVYLEERAPLADGEVLERPALLRHGATTTVSVSPVEIENELAHDSGVALGRRGEQAADRRLAALFRLCHRLNRVEDEQRFFEALLQLVAELFPRARVALFLEDDTTPHVAVVPRGVPDFHKRPPPVEPMVEARSNAKAVLVLPTPGRDSAPLGRRSQRASSVLIAPLLDDADAVSALMLVEGWPPATELGADDLRMLAILASQAAIMLRNVRLQATNRRALERLERTRAEVERINRELEDRVAERTRDIQRLAEIVTHATDAIIEMDAEGRIRNWNEAALRLLGYPADELEGKRLRALVCPHGHPAALAPWHRFAEARRAEAVGAVWRNAEGEPIDVQVSLFSIGAPEQPGIAAIVRDVGERNRLHENLVEASKLAAIGALSAEFAHEFNNLLAGIVGNAELLGFESELSEEGRACLEAIVETGQRAREAIARFLRLGHGEQDGRERLALTDVLREAIALVERKLYMRNVRVEQTIEEVPIVYGNRCRLALMVASFLANAADAAEPGDAIALRLGVEEDRAVAVVEDRGCGMDQSTRDRMFDPYFSTKPGSGARGLGLSIAREIAKWHGGSIRVDSRPGHGTTVTVRLPLAGRCAPPAEPARSCPPRTDEMDDLATAPPPERGTETPAPTLSPAGDAAAAVALRVVVVDDEDDVRAAVAGMVRRLGHEVCAFASADAVLRHLEEAPVDVVVSDYAMPGCTGLELLARLRERGHDTLPLILVTGYAPPRLAEQAIQRPRALLRKPFTMRELAAALAGLERRGDASLA